MNILDRIILHFPYFQSKRRRVVALIVLSIIIAYFLVNNALDIPTGSALVRKSQQLYQSYGYRIAFFAAFLEAFFVVGVYAPGSVVVVLGAAFCAEGIMDIRKFILAAAAGFWSAYTINYLIGATGWYRLLAKFGELGAVSTLQDRLVSMRPIRRRVIMFLSFFSPNLGGLWSTTLGTLRWNVVEFVVVSVLATLFWTIFWGTFAYLFGDLAFRVIESTLFPLVVVLSFVVFFGFARRR